MVMLLVLVTRKCTCPMSFLKLSMLAVTIIFLLFSPDMSLRPLVTVSNLRNVRVVVCILGVWLIVMGEDRWKDMCFVRDEKDSRPWDVQRNNMLTE